MRYHRKADGILMVDDNGRGRFLTLFERILFAFGRRPRFRSISQPPHTRNESRA